MLGVSDFFIKFASMEENTILQGLNEPQKKAVVSTEGRIRVIAGAGSGKTRVLTKRYIYLVDVLGINPANILCMTFTNKAAQEMRNRITATVDFHSVNDFICTIHSFCLKVLRKDIYRMGFPKTFTILDEEDQKAIAREVFKDFHVTRQQNTLDKFVKGMTAYKAEHKTSYIHQYMLPETQYNPQSDKVLDYLNRQVQLMALDFNDIIHFAVYLLKTYEEVRAYWQNQLNYIMMDEGQDCNENDWLLMNMLSEKSNNLFVVGDPDQAIYEWRGAVPKLFIDFVPDKDIVLTENYRSTPNILGVANSIIHHNVNRIEKQLFTHNQDGPRMIHFHAKTEKEEAAWLADRIAQLIEVGARLTDFAVLYRSSYLSREVEQALVKKGFPYSIWGGVRFFERKEIKDAIAYLRLIETGDDLAFLRIINVPSRKVGRVFISKLGDFAKNMGLSLYETLVQHCEDKAFHKKSVLDFIALIEECREKKSRMTISDLLDDVLRRSGLLELVRKDGDEDRLENLTELQLSVKVYEKENRNEEISLATYLQEIALYTDEDADNKKNTIKLMTIHQAKGLEFPYVFVVGLNEGIFPNARTIRERKKEGEEEERRLMYVAVTRAEKALFLTDSEGYSSSAQTDKYPSRFLLEIQKKFVVLEGKMDASLLEGTRGLISQEKIARGEIPPDYPFHEGDAVRHKVFGSGVVLKVNSDHSCVVKFYGGERCVMPRFLQPEDVDNTRSGGEDS